MVYNTIFDFVKRRCISVSESLTKAIKAFKEKDYKEGLKESGKVVLFYAGLMIICVLLFNFSRMAYIFITSNQNFIFKLGVGAIIILAFILPKIKLPETLLPIDPVAANKNYGALGKSLLFVVNRISLPLGLIAPPTVEALTTMGTALYHMNGKTPFYQYIVRKANIDTHIPEKISKPMLQECFEQMENALQLPCGNGEGYVYNGRRFCTILVMSVIDCGSYLQVELALAGDDSCHKYLMAKIGVGLSDNSKADTKDEHFKD